MAVRGGAGNNSNTMSNNNIGGGTGEKMVCLGEIFMAIQWQPRTDGSEGVRCRPSLPGWRPSLVGSKDLLSAREVHWRLLPPETSSVGL